MNRLTVIAVAVAVVVTITVSTLLTRSSAGSLPIPHIPAATAGHNASANKNGGGGGSSGGSNGGSGAYRSGPVPTLSGCSVSVSDASPLRGQTAETVTVTSTPDVQVSVVAEYAHTRSRHGGVTDSAGAVSLSFPVAHAPVGVTVGVTATASLRGQHVTCSTSFTPVL